MCLKFETGHHPYLLKKETSKRYLVPYLYYIHIFQTIFLETVVMRFELIGLGLENFPGLAHPFNMNATGQIAKNNSISIIDQSCKPKMHLIETVKSLQSVGPQQQSFLFFYIFFFFWK